jgi:restriction endonuclease
MKTTVSRLALTKARVNLGQVCRVHLNRELFILEKDGIPVVGLMHVDDLEDYLEMRNRSVKAQIQTSAAEYRRGAARSAHEFLAELKPPTGKRSPIPPPTPSSPPR